MPNSDHVHSGHRQRLKERFLASGPCSLSETELLELLLTYAIPRRDVAPLADLLLAQFGDLSSVLAASHQQLTEVSGIGEQAAILLEVTAHVAAGTWAAKNGPDGVPEQPALLEVEPDLGPLFDQVESPAQIEMRTFTNDLSKAALQYLPQATGFDGIADYQAFLEQNLPTIPSHPESDTPAT